MNTCLPSFTLFVWLVAFTLSTEPAHARLQPDRLRCEHEENPLAVESPQPRLSWILQPGARTARGVGQTSYRILVASTEETLRRDTGDLWDSGRVESDRSTLVPYGGAPLRSRQEVFWKVRVWDQERRPSAWSAPARFSIGLLGPGDWQAGWITAPTPATGSFAGQGWVWSGPPDDRRMYPPGSRHFRRVLVLPPECKVRDARVVMTADNRFTLLVNGHEALQGDDFQRAWVAAIDTWLRPGTNVLAVIASNGGTRPNEAGLMGRFDLAFADGQTLSVPVDASWACHAEAVAGWEQADFDAAAWPAAHVLGPYGMQPWGAVVFPASPLPLFRREFDLAKPARRARLYVCGLGQYELCLNGTRVGDEVLAPAWTDYRDRCSYRAFDVTSQLVSGPNALGVFLGNGMYNVAGGRYVKFRGSFGPPKLILQLEIDHPDGTVSRIPSDSSWRTTPGPIVFSCTFGGEDYDARRDSPGWTRPGFDDRSWVQAVPADGPGGVLRAQVSPPLEIQHEFPTLRVTQPQPGQYVYDLGQNFSGWPKLTVRGRAGATVKLVPGERLGPDGLVSQQSSGGPTWFSYTLRGDGVEIWAPRFSYYGFRYVQVEGAAPAEETLVRLDRPRVLALTGQFLYSSAPVAGDFACSNELVNRIHRLILAAIRCNLQSVLTDCPHREKLGWLEVSHLLADGITFNFDASRFYAKLSQDMRESQTEAGLVPDIAPEFTVFSGGFRDSPEWGSACAFNPAHVLRVYGDESLLTGHQDVIARYLAYLGTTAKDHIVSHGLGDWYDIGPNPPGESQLTSKGLTSTAIYYGALKILEDAARRKGETAEAARHAQLAEAVRTAFNGQFFDRAHGQYDRGSQTAQAMPLVLGLVERDLEASVLESLVRAVVTNHHRVTAGDVGFSYVVRALGDAGRDDLLYRMVTQTNGPGYADQLRKGATTLTEAWDANPASSHNHCMLGHAEGWFYSGLAGIRPDPAFPGYQRFTIRPAVLADLAWVRAHHESPYGRIRSAWERHGDQLTLEATIPANTTARVFIPTTNPTRVRESGRRLRAGRGIQSVQECAGHVVAELGSGTYRFESPCGPAGTLSPPDP